MVTFNINKIEMKDDSSGIKYNVELPKIKDISRIEKDFVRIEKELQEVKAKLSEDEEDYSKVEASIRSAQEHNWTALANFAASFTSSTLANLAGGYLHNLLPH